jgi:undecaprenyl diphosphate synthase
MRERLPIHVGIIMDGNGRWAERRGQPRVFGHRAGAAAVRRVVEAAAQLGIEQLTLFAFSTENWKRPADEIGALMLLFKRYLRSEVTRLLDNGVRLRAIGRLHELAPDVRRELERVVRATRQGEGMTLCLAINYGGHSEIVDSCRDLARRAVAGSIHPDDIDEAAVQASLYQPDMPGLDLIIRTGGEMRLSNFLLWQAAYAEISVTPLFWPDFDRQHLEAALEAFAARERRFGALGEPLCATGT